MLGEKITFELAAEVPVPALMVQAFGMVTLPNLLSDTKVIETGPSAVCVCVNSYLVVPVVPPISTISTVTNWAAVPMPQSADKVTVAEAVELAY